MFACRAVEASEWLPQIQRIMQVAGAAVDLIDVQGSSVMLCLEDGWDLTAQVGGTGSGQRQTVLLNGLLWFVLVVRSLLGPIYPLKDRRLERGHDWSRLTRWRVVSRSSVSTLVATRQGHRGQADTLCFLPFWMRCSFEPLSTLCAGDTSPDNAQPG